LGQHVVSQTPQIVHVSLCERVNRNKKENIVVTLAKAFIRSASSIGNLTNSKQDESSGNNGNGNDYHDALVVRGAQGGAEAKQPGADMEDVEVPTDGPHPDRLLAVGRQDLLPHPRAAGRPRRRHVPWPVPSFFLFIYFSLFKL
jgi:hypothetical protein